MEEEDKQYLSQVGMYLADLFYNQKNINMKQTAVEWLAELIECGADLEQLKKCLPKAKAIEKEQIVQAITKTIIGSNVIYGSEYPEVIHTAEQYYNQTFKSE